MSPSEAFGAFLQLLTGGASEQAKHAAYNQLDATGRNLVATMGVFKAPRASDYYVTDAEGEHWVRFGADQVGYDSREAACQWGVLQRSWCNPHDVLTCIVDGPGKPPDGPMGAPPTPRQRDTWRVVFAVIAGREQCLAAQEVTE